jgi:hypothetical protein
MKNGLEGIVKLSDKWVKLEDIENPRLQKILHSRLRNIDFNFKNNCYNENNPKKINLNTKDDSYVEYEDKINIYHLEYHMDNELFGGSYHEQIEFYNKDSSK